MNILNRRPGLRSTMKALTVIILLLLLLIPLNMIKSVIWEREGRAASVSEEIIQGAGGRLVFRGPLAAIPYTVEDRVKVGDEYEIFCSIKVSLATFPGNSMKAFYSGGASMMVSVRGFKAEYEQGLFKDVLEGAAQGARQHIMASYLNSQ